MKYFRSYVSAQFSSVSVVRMFGNNNVNGGTRQTNLVVKLILCLIVPAYHTLQAELGKRSKLNIAAPSNLVWILLPLSQQMFWLQF